MQVGCGRGPTRFISPRRMLTSCGSSSRRKCRSHLPTRVMRSELSCTHSDRRCSPGCIVRNLSRLNGRPPRPIRSWTNSTGPSESSLIASAIRASSGASTSQAHHRHRDADRSRDDLRSAVIAESPRVDQRARCQGFDRHLPDQPLVELERVFDDDAPRPRFEQRFERQLSAPIAQRHDDAIGADFVDDHGESIEASEPDCASAFAERLVVQNAGEHVPRRRQTTRAPRSASTPADRSRGSGPST